MRHASVVKFESVALMSCGPSWSRAALAANVNQGILAKNSFRHEGVLKSGLKLCNALCFLL